MVLQSGMACHPNPTILVEPECLSLVTQVNHFKWQNHFYFYYLKAIHMKLLSNNQCKCRELCSFIWNIFILPFTQRTQGGSHSLNYSDLQVLFNAHVELSWTLLSTSLTFLFLIGLYGSGDWKGWDLSRWHPSMHGDSYSILQCIDVTFSYAAGSDVAAW